MMVDISVNMLLETHINSNLNKNKVNIKIVILRPAPYTLKYLKFVLCMRIIQIMITYLWNAYVEIIQISYHSDRTILSYEESARFTGTTLVHTTYNVLLRYLAFVSRCYSLLPIMLKIFDVICQLADDFYEKKKSIFK